MIKKITYELNIGGKNFLLFKYRVSHSIFTITSKAEILVDKPAEIGSDIELKLGYDDDNELVFWGQVSKITKEGENYLIKAINTLPLKKDILTASLKDVSPKEILKYIGLEKLIYTNKNLQIKHHFPIWKINKLQIIKQILKTWNLKDFVYFLDLDKNFHFHSISEYWEKITEIKDKNMVIDNSNHLIKMPLNVDLFINQRVKVLDTEYKVLSVIHSDGNTYLEIENV